MAKTEDGVAGDDGMVGRSSSIPNGIRVLPRLPSVRLFLARLLPMKLSLSAKVSRSGMLVFWVRVGMKKESRGREGETINGTDYLESPGKTFRMGFFSLEMESDRRHVGIWYAMDPKTVVWVANREYPLPDSSGVLTVTDDGNFKVLDKDQKVYFDTEIDNCRLFGYPC
ncbi:hypothetical protein L1987_58153 [Smallanthus sonchifolius]|uniref:Uncharacterized protein n=1 Tax=Smallanthus sonchifolius TaxID=185202 RepID=A0ACB9DET3_9ASTR|nr:hypothetical protein L1987_58153 [Smallanthus sonchifolius]